MNKYIGIICLAATASSTATAIPLEASFKFDESKASAQNIGVQCSFGSEGWQEAEIPGPTRVRL